MRWEDQEGSDNVEDRRSESGGGFGRAGFRIPRFGIPGGGRGSGGLGLGTIIVIGLIMFALGVDPRTLFDGGIPTGGSNGFDDGYEQQGPAPQVTEQSDRTARFVSSVLRTTEDVWTQTFNEQGATYQKPKLVLFSGVLPSACGTAQAAMGPFYCPTDRKVYLDMSFFDELARRFKAPGDFAQAYVIGHEIGHHVQNLLGILPRVQQAQSRMNEVQRNALQVKVELQADCFAGVWAKRADDSKKILEAGDVDEAMEAASAIGDDRLQKQAQGTVVPESFTHGSSAQRQQWFMTGMKAGEIEACDTFKGKI